MLACNWFASNKTNLKQLDFKINQFYWIKFKNAVLRLINSDLCASYFDSIEPITLLCKNPTLI